MHCPVTGLLFLSTHFNISAYFMTFTRAPYTVTAQLPSPELKPESCTESSFHWHMDCKAWSSGVCSCSFSVCVSGMAGEITCAIV